MRFDKASALVSYAKQAKDEQLEKMARRIRNRAQRRAGELLKVLPRNETPNPSGSNQHTGEVSGQAPRQPSAYAQAISDADINDRTAREYQSIANIPEQDFENMNESDNPPSLCQAKSVLNGAGSSRNAEFHQEASTPKAFNFFDDVPMQQALQYRQQASSQPQVAEPQR